MGDPAGDSVVWLGKDEGDVDSLRAKGDETFARRKRGLSPIGITRIPSVRLEVEGTISFPRKLPPRHDRRPDWQSVANLVKERGKQQQHLWVAAPQRQKGKQVWILTGQQGLLWRSWLSDRRL